MAGEEDLGTLVDLLRRDRRQHPYRGRHEYSQAARAVADICERLIGAGDAAEALPMLRKAVDRMTRALMYMDDSSGIVGDDLHHIMSLYARACTAAPPKPAALAKWLVTLACDGPGWPRILLRPRRRPWRTRPGRDHPPHRGARANCRSSVVDCRLLGTGSAGATGGGVRRPRPLRHRSCREPHQLDPVRTDHPLPARRR